MRTWCRSLEFINVPHSGRWWPSRCSRPPRRRLSSMFMASAIGPMSNTRKSIRHRILTRLRLVFIIKHSQFRSCTSAVHPGSSPVPNHRVDSFRNTRPYLPSSTRDVTALRKDEWCRGYASILEEFHSCSPALRLG